MNSGNGDLLKTIKENLTELYWEDTNGQFYIVGLYSKQEGSVTIKELDARKIEPIGDASYVVDDGKTPYREVMHNILEVMLSDFPDNEAFMRINAYSFASLNLTANKDEQRDDPLAHSYPWVTINFYHLHD